MTNLLILLFGYTPMFFVYHLYSSCRLLARYQQIWCVVALRVPAGQTGINCLTQWEVREVGAVQPKHKANNQV